MTEAQRALAQRWVDSKYWRPEPWLVWSGDRDTKWVSVTTTRDARKLWPYAGFLPDLSYDATLGCLLGDVRRAWGDPTIHVRPNTIGSTTYWQAWAGELLRSADGSPLGQFLSEAEALVVAREAAS